MRLHLDKLGEAAMRLHLDKLGEAAMRLHLDKPFDRLRASSAKRYR